MKYKPLMLLSFAPQSWHLLADYIGGMIGLALPVPHLWRLSFYISAPSHLYPQYSVIKLNSP